MGSSEVLVNLVGPTPLCSFITFVKQEIIISTKFSVCDVMLQIFVEYANNSRLNVY